MATFAEAFSSIWAATAALAAAGSWLAAITTMIAVGTLIGARRSTRGNFQGGLPLVAARPILAARWIAARMRT